MKILNDHIHRNIKSLKRSLAMILFVINTTEFFYTVFNKLSFPDLYWFNANRIRPRALEIRREVSRLCA
jgi:hypothetical protein